jgi:diadenosine tetraphosphate (Ap4A) HIT family hydrolase
MNSDGRKAWSLHAQLTADTVPVGDLPLSRLLLAKDANYPWLILVPRLPGLVELIDLEENAQVQLLGEVAATARALKMITECHKLNIAALGNQVPQFHVHVIARRQTDVAWPRPVWGVSPPLAYAAGEQASLMRSLQEQLKTSGLAGIDR